MVDYSLDKLLKLPHLAQFSLNDIYTKLGLYEDIVIDTFELETNVYLDEKDNIEYEQLVAGKDVRMLEILRYSKDAFMLPCMECQKSQAFKGMNSYYGSIPDSRKKIIFPINDCNCDTEILCEYQKNEFDDYEHYYSVCLNPSRIKCKNNVLLPNTKFSREYSCQLDETHRVYGEFLIQEVQIKENPPREVMEYREKLDQAAKNHTEKPKMDKIVEDYYVKLAGVQGYVILKKIGQYPSMADMQFFECNKYRKILKDNYRDYTMALGLYASGVGCGSFLYLRRIFESIVEEFHQECLKEELWNEEEFSTLRFNEKIKKIESFGKCIIPPEIEFIRSNLYGVLSKGVHKSSEDECKELFPYIKYVIDIILDSKIAKKEKADKLKQIQIKFQNQ